MQRNTHGKLGYLYFHLSKTRNLGGYVFRLGLIQILHNDFLTISNETCTDKIQAFAM